MRSALSSAFILTWPLPSAFGSCWIDGYSRDFCCNTQFGPTGNDACWDDVFHYDPCCNERDITANVDGELEQAFGHKLDAVLEGTTAEQLELDLRTAVASPEGRTMAARTSRLFLVMLLRRVGRDAEAMIELRRVTDEGDLSISEHGIWMGSTAAGYHMHDSTFAEALVHFLREQRAQTISDFGCGLGLYVKELRDAGFRAGGFDGNPATARISEGRCHTVDLSQHFDFGTRWDWLLSLEVAEHIPAEFEESFLGNLDRHNHYGIVLSWANQAGEGHVNLRTRQDVEELFATRGYRSDEASATRLREAASLPWLSNTVLVFKRIL